MENQYILKMQRNEFKYLVPKGQIESFISFFKSTMTPDNYSKNGYYTVSSIYFDSFDFNAYYEKNAGIENRKKFRIRSYIKDLSPSNKVFVEIKQKVNDVILKRRFPVKYNEISDSVNFLFNSKKHKDYSSEWNYHIVRKGLKPKILVEYDRMAFNAVSNQNLRITIDKNLRYSAMVNKEFDFTKNTIDVEVMKEYSLLEVKFRSVIPKWLRLFIMKSSLNNEAFSKYTKCLVHNKKLKLF